MKTKKESCKGTVVSARRLRQYLQLQDKNSRSISRYSFILFVILQNSYTVEPLITDTAGEFKFCPL
jgi:hypothetical protein